MVLTMARTDINLGNYPDGGDMVVAFNQTALNNHLQTTFRKLHQNPKYRHKVNFSLFLCNRVIQSQGNSSVIVDISDEPPKRSRADLLRELNLKDTKRAQAHIVSNQNLSKLRELGIVTAIEGSWFDYLNEKGKPVLEICPENNGDVFFNLTFKDLRVFTIEGNKESYYDHSQVQKQERFALRFRAKLEQKKVAIHYDDLSEDLKHQVGSAQYFGLFSVQQLYVNLKNAHILNSGQQSEWASALSAEVIALLTAQGNDGEILSLGETLIPHEHAGKNIPELDPEFAPKHLAFSTKYNQASPENSALVYHFSTNVRHKPRPTLYPWNWFDGKSKEPAGIMVAAPELYLRSFLESILKVCAGNEVCPYLLKVDGSVSGVDLSAKLSHDSGANLKWKQSTPGKKREYAIEYSSNWRGNGYKETKGWGVDYEDIQYGLSWDFGLKCELGDNKLVVSSYMTGIFEYNQELGEIVLKTEGYIFPTTKRIKVFKSSNGLAQTWVSVSAKHELVFKPDSQGRITLVVKEDGHADSGMGLFDPPKWSRLHTPYQQLKKAADPTLKAITNGSYLETILANAYQMKPWIFPGGKSLSFKTAELSDYGDLTVGVKFSNVLKKGAPESTKTDS